MERLTNSREIKKKILFCFPLPYFLNFFFIFLFYSSFSFFIKFILFFEVEKTFTFFMNTRQIIVAVALLCFFTVIFLLTSFSSHSQEISYRTTNEAMYTGGAAMQKMAPSPAFAPAADNAFAGTVESAKMNPSTPDRVVLTTVSVGLVVSDISASVGKINTLITNIGKGAFISSSSISPYSSSLTARVPAEELASFIKSLKSLASSVSYEYVEIFHEAYII